MLMHLVFEFNDRAAMTCRYDKVEQAIVYASLVPMSPSLKGKYQYYIPDGTYDYMRFEKGIWRKYEMVFEERGKKHGGDLRKW